MGSEGVFGVVTQASLRLHRQPEANWQRAFVLPAFRQGIRAVRDILQADLQPSLLRLSDAQETRTLSAFSERDSAAAHAAQTGVQTEAAEPNVILLLAFEGDDFAKMIPPLTPVGGKAVDWRAFIGKLQLSLRDGVLPKGSKQSPT